MYKVFDSADFRERFHTDAPLGAFCGEHGTRFTLWAPTAQQVTLRLYDAGDGGFARERIAMTPGERGVWTYDDNRNLDGTYYDYEIEVDGVTRGAGDPYARACGLNGWRSMVIDLARTNPDGWEDDRAPERPVQDVIYELHVKDFTWDAAGGVPEALRGKYLGLTCEGTQMDGMPTCLEHIKSLGVTHVQLMPVYDYGSVDEAGAPDAFNWGYDPVNYNVPDGSYSTDASRGEVRIRELKQMIAALHRSGLRVVMDVVYNHTYGLDSCLFNTVPWYFYRQTPRGKASNGSGCGNEIASERSMAARYIADSVMYWAEEYHIDGFRFDLMGLLDVHLMNRIRRELDKRFGKGEKILYGEPWRGGKSHPRGGTMLADKGNLRRLDSGIGAFCDCTRDAIKGTLMNDKAGGFASGGEFNAGWMACCVRGWVSCGDAFPVKAPSQTITYLCCHDDWTLWDKLVLALDPNLDYAKNAPDILRANRLAAAMLFCCQGHLFMLSGEEFGRTKMGVRNSYRSPLAINRIDWKRAKENAALVDYYKGLIALRKTLPGLCDLSENAAGRIRAVWHPMGGVGVIELDNTGKNGEGSAYDTLLMIFNTTKETARVELPQSTWRVLADGENSGLWRGTYNAEGSAEAAPVSALILGR